ncbi:hypothetical protein D3C75_995650 [compost metagenome]
MHGGIQQAGIAQGPVAAAFGLQPAAQRGHAEREHGAEFLLGGHRQLPGQGGIEKAAHLLGQGDGGGGFVRRQAEGEVHQEGLQLRRMPA